MRHTSFVALQILILIGSSSAGIFSKRNLLLRSFKSRPCAGHPGVVQIQELDLSSTADGSLIVGGTVSSALNLTSPLKVKISMARKVFGLVDVPVPCIKKFGSCTFENVCELAYPDDRSCPGKFDEHDVPCRCPVEQGRYTLPGAQFSVDPTRWASLLSGSYSGSARLFSNSRPLACYDYSFELQ